jgi:hypothetical protein
MSLIKMQRRSFTLLPFVGRPFPVRAATAELPHLRRERYLQFAMAARERAEYCADDRLRERFLSRAKVWQGLADFIDRSHSNYWRARGTASAKRLQSHGEAPAPTNLRQLRAPGRI